MRLVVLVLFNLIFTLSFSQDVASDLKKINKAFYAGSFKGNIEYSLFQKSTDPVARETSKGEFIHSKKNMWLLMDNFEFIQTPDYTLTVNNKKKYVAFFEIRNNKEQSGQDKNIYSQQLMALIDTVVKYSEKVAYVNTKEYGKYTISLPKSTGYKKVVIQFNKQNYLIKRVDMHYYQKVNPLEKNKITASPMLSVIYSNLELNPDFKESLFSVSKYLDKRGNHYSVTNRYKGYELIHK